MLPFVDRLWPGVWQSTFWWIRRIYIGTFYSFSISVPTSDEANPSSWVQRTHLQPSMQKYMRITIFYVCVIHSWYIGWYLIFISHWLVIWEGGGGLYLAESSIFYRDDGIIFQNYFTQMVELFYRNILPRWWNYFTEIFYKDDWIELSRATGNM